MTRDFVLLWKEPIPVFMGTMSILWVCLKMGRISYLLMTWGFTFGTWKSRIRLFWWLTSNLRRSMSWMKSSLAVLCLRSTIIMLFTALVRQWLKWSISEREATAPTQESNTRTKPQKRTKISSPKLSPLFLILNWPMMEIN